MSKRILPKQKRLIAAVAKGKSISQAAKEVGYHPVYASHLLKQPQIREALLKAMDTAGINFEVVSQKIREGLDAVYPKRYSAKGKLIQDNEPDFLTRSVYLEKILKILGAFAPHQEERIEKQINVTLTPELLKGLIDTEVISQSELKALTGEVIKEENNGKQ